MKTELRSGGGVWRSVRSGKNRCFRGLGVSTIGSQSLWLEEEPRTQWYKRYLKSQNVVCCWIWQDERVFLYYCYSLAFKTTEMVVFFPCFFFFFPWSPFNFLQPFFFFPLSSRQFPLPSQLTPLTPLYSNPAPRSVDPSPKPCHNHVESGIWHAGQTASLQYLAQQHKHISKPGPDIGRRGRNRRSAQLLWLWPAALTSLTTVCREEAPPSSGIQWAAQAALCANSLRPSSR